MYISGITEAIVNFTQVGYITKRMTYHSPIKWAWLWSRDRF